MRVLVIYYDGNEHKAEMRETDLIDSSVPRVFGLPDDHDIIAVVHMTGDRSEPLEVYIDEMKVEL